MEHFGGHPPYPPILFVYQGTTDDGPTFFARDWPTARAVADPDRQLYRAFGIERGNSDQFINPGIIACGIRATLKGNFIGRPQGDPRLMPGLFLVTTDSILWQHDYRHPGDHPDFATLPALFAPLTRA
jgi:hypothetical protein